MSLPRVPALLLCLSAAIAAAPGCAPDAITRANSPAVGGAPAATTAGDEATASDPHFLRAAAGAPTIANPVVRFWAKRGADRTGEMVYHAAPGKADSVVFFSLRVRARSLLARPDGTPIAPGDSVLITLTLVDPDRLIVDCQPAGLRFHPDAPARLRMSFAETNPDVNGDGVVSGQDLALTHRLAVWLREDTLSPWLRLPTAVDSTAHEVETEIGGFSGYVIAW